jgi:large repetitive protein
MLKQFILFGAALLLVGCKPVHPCDIGASPLSCDIVESIPEPYMTITKDMSLTEGGSAGTAEVKLHFRKPDGTVVVDVASADTTEATVSPSTLTFTTSNWETAQTITVTPVNDYIDDDNQTVSITASINDGSTGDDYYDALSDMSVTASIADIHTAGVTVNTSSHTVAEGGGTSSFTYVLDTKPSANVIVATTDNDATEAASSPSSLTFTTSNWNTPQTITITGQTDNIDDGNVNSSITVASSSTDTKYNSFSNTINVTTTDIDTANFVIAQSSGSSSTSEAGSTDTYTVTLSTIPSSNVRLDIASDNTSELTVSPSSITFTPANWSTAQTVTMTGQDDNTSDGSQSVTITTSVDSVFTSDTNYSSLSNQTFTATNSDNDNVGIIVACCNIDTGRNGTSRPQSIRIPENGGVATYTVTLRSQPFSDVILTIVDIWDTKSSSSPDNLTFTTSNWNTPQTVTVTSLDNSYQESANDEFTVRTGNPVISNDSAYSALNYRITWFDHIDDD